MGHHGDMARAPGDPRSTTAGTGPTGEAGPTSETAQTADTADTADTGEIGDTGELGPTDGRPRFPPPWELPWRIRLGVPAAAAFVAQFVLMLAVGRPVVAALAGGLLMAAFVAAWLRWSLPRRDARWQARRERPGLGGWANPGRWQHQMNRWFAERNARRRGTNPLSGNRRARR